MRVTYNFTSFLVTINQQYNGGFMGLLTRVITFMVAGSFFVQNSFAKPPDGPSGGSKSSSSGSKSSSSGSKSSSSGSKSSGGSTGRADRDQQGGSQSSSSGSKSSSSGSKSSSGSTGRADRDQQGGSKSSSSASKSSSGGSKSTSSGSSGRADRDQQGGSKSSSSVSKMGGSSDSSGRADRDQQGGSKSSSSGSKTTSSGSSGRADRDQQGGSSSSSKGSTTGRADRDQQGGSSSSGKSSTTGRADRDQQGGTRSPASSQTSAQGAVSNLATAARSLAERAIEIGKQAASKTKDVVVRAVQPHYEAVKAGIEAQKRAPMGTIGAGSFGYQLSQERAYYKGVKDYYEKNNIKNEFVPTGPMAAQVRGQQLNELELAVVRAIDDAYRDANAIVADPSKMTDQHVQQLIGVDLYNELVKSPAQYLGFKNSTVVIGKKRDLAEAAGKFAMNLYQNGFYMDSLGVIYVDNSKKKTKDILEFRDLILHESQHAGDSNLYDAALADKNSQIAARIVEILRPAQELKQNPDIAMLYPEYYNPDLKYTNGGYATTLTEMRAFAQTDLNKKDWAENFAHEYDLELEEAEVIGEILLESPVLQRDLQVTDEYAKQLLGGQ